MQPADDDPAPAGCGGGDRSGSRTCALHRAGERSLCPSPSEVRSAGCSGMARIINGAEISRVLRAQIAAEVAELRAPGIVPGLAVVLVGNDPASEVYVRGKAQACREAGMGPDARSARECSPMSCSE